MNAKRASRFRFSPATAFVMFVSRLISLKPPALYQVEARRSKGDADLKSAGLPPGKDIAVEDIILEGTELSARVYWPIKDSQAGIILYFHGGGWALGTVDANDSIARGICGASSTPVVSVEYRLAPEQPFPAAALDAMAAYRWALVEGSSASPNPHTQLKPGLIFVSGDSAGGNLAASLCLMAKKEGLPQPAGQILFYPVTDISRTDNPSYQRYAHGCLLTKADMEWFISLYAPLESRSDVRASPLLAKDLSALAPALILTAEYDVLRDEGEAYAQRLADAGVPVRLERIPGMVHGFVSMGRFVPEAKKAFQLSAQFIRQYNPHLRGS